MLDIVRLRPTSPDDAVERLRRLDGDVERQIRDAIERGELAHLDGEGRPLPHDADDGLGERWAAAHVVRSAGMSPEWVELRRDIHERREELVRRARAHAAWLVSRRMELSSIAAERILDHARATAEEDRRVRAGLEETRRELNADVRRHNLLVGAALQLVPLDAERLDRLADEEDA